MSLKQDPDPPGFTFCPLTRAFNTSKLLIFRDMLGTLQKDIDYDKPLQKLPLYLPGRGSIDCNYTADRAWMREIFSHPRHDPNNANSFFRSGTNQEIIIKVMRAIFKDPGYGDDDCILSASKEVNEKFRKVIMEHLSKESIEKHIADITAVVETELSQWDWTEHVNITEACSRLALTVLIRVFLKSDVDIKPILVATHYLNDWIYQSVVSEKVPDDNFHQVCSPLLNIVHSVYESTNTDTIIAQMKKSSDFNERQVKGMILVLFFAGQETTASLLADIIWQLSKNAEYQRRLRQSLEEDSSNMLHHAVAEGLRLFSPAWGIGRFAKVNLTAEGFPIAVKNAINVCPFLAGRDPTQFKDPERFNPEREESILHFPWLPFGHGAHACPGKHLALTEIYICLELLLRKTKMITTEQIEDIPLVGMITLKRSKDLFVKLQ